MKTLGGPLGQSNLAGKRLNATKASKVWFSYSHNWTSASGAVFYLVCQVLPTLRFRTHTTALWPMQQSSILSAKFDCPVVRQSISLLATAHDCKTGLFTTRLTPLVPRPRLLGAGRRGSYPDDNNSPDQAMSIY